MREKKRKVLISTYPVEGGATVWHHCNEKNGKIVKTQWKVYIQSECRYCKAIFVHKDSRT